MNSLRSGFFLLPCSLASCAPGEVIEPPTYDAPTGSNDHGPALGNAYRGSPK
jgi:hypothetical protein